MYPSFIPVQSFDIRVTGVSLSDFYYLYTTPLKPECKLHLIFFLEPDIYILTPVKECLGIRFIFPTTKISFGKTQNFASGVTKSLTVLT